MTHLLQAEFSYEALQFLPLVVLWLARHLQDRGNVVLHAHLAEDGGLLRQIADTLAGTLVDRIPGDLLIVQPDVPGIGHHKTGGHIEAGGLTGTVGAQQTYYLTLMHVEANVIHHRTLTVDLHKAFAAQLHNVVVLFLHSATNLQLFLHSRPRPPGFSLTRAPICR